MCYDTGFYEVFICLSVMVASPATGESLPSLVAILPLFLSANEFMGDSLLNLPVGKVKCCKRIQGLPSPVM